MNYSVLCEWVRRVTGYDNAHVIQANQTGPRPSIPYCTVQITLSEEDHNPVKTRAAAPDDMVTLKYSHGRIVTVTVNAYGDSGDSVLAQLGISDNLWAIRKYLRDNGAALKTKRQTRDLSRFEETVFIKRFLADFEFLEYAENQENVEEILQWETSGEVE